MSERNWEADCAKAFASRNKQAAELLLAHTRPPVVRVTFRFYTRRKPRGTRSSMVGLVSLLHLAAYWGWMDIAVLLVCVYNCDANRKDGSGSLSLHYAAFNGHLEVVRYFITEQSCDPLETDRRGLTALHNAAERGHLNIVQFLIGEAQCNPSCKDRGGSTPLHYACRNGHFNIVQYLVSEAQCNPSCKDRGGITPLHYACVDGHLSIVQYLISVAHCNPSCKDEGGSTPLHYACIYRHLSIVQYLISEARCNPSCHDNYVGKTPLHQACGNGHLRIVQYLISEARCNPSCKDKGGSTPLQYACIHGHFNIVKYLISEAHCNPSCEDNYGSTPLHIACRRNNIRIVQYLLSTGCVYPLDEDMNGDTALYYASGKYDLVKLLQPWIDSSRDYPVHRFTKLILTGDSGAGKTTIAELIIFLARESSSPVAVDHVTNVQCFTAGIVPHHIESKLGNFVLYDFAGQQEYYSSHAAILEQVMCKSAAMFLCMIDLSKTNESICQSLQYWLTFINNACSTVEGRSSLLIIGSHADLVQSSDEMEEKRLMLHKIANVRVKYQEYAGFVTMDCRKTNTNASRMLISILMKSRGSIIVSQPAVSFYCHLLYAFLCTKLNKVSCTLLDLISAINREKDTPLPSDPSILTEFLTVLSDKGLILFLKHPKSSWIVIKMNSLLNEINGTLFAPPHFREYCGLASNTGIVPISNLLKVFPHYSSEMLIGVLESLDFCRPVDHSVLQYTNLQTTTPSHSTADLLFFPGLIQSERPDSLIQQGTLQFGWCLGCMDDHQFLSSRFLHVLLLSVAYKFPLNIRTSSSSSLRGLQRMCTIWRNGISWRSDDNITTALELLDNNRLLLLAMSYNEDSQVKFAKLCSSLIFLVRHLQQEHCSQVEVHEFLISPDYVQQYPFDNLPDTALFDIYHVARSILCRKPIILSNDGQNHLDTQSLYFEPYHFLTPFYTCQLFNPNMSNQPVPATLLHEVRQFCQHSNTKPLYKELREYLDSLSIFAGRNPMVSVCM